MSPRQRRRWDAAVDDAVKANAIDPDLTDEDREKAAAVAQDFRATLYPAAARRFDQERAIASGQDAWRRSVPPDRRDTEEQMREKMAASLRNLWSGKKIAIRVTPQNLEQILADGRFKTVHETGTTSGFNNTKNREDLERQVFGVYPDSDLSKRPVYGYVAVNGIRRPGLDAALGQYGSTQVVLKDEVRRRTTASNGDSMGKRNSVRPSPVDTPQFWSYQTAGQPPGQYDVDGERLMSRGYAEAQIHGGVTVDDIEEVVFAREPDEGLRRMLEQQGVKWRLID